MLNKILPKAKQNPWGDDHPEKLNQSAKKHDWKQQVADLVNPNNFVDQIFRNPRDLETPSYPQPETTPRRVETLVFSRETRRADLDIKRETHVILDQLKKQVTVLQKSEKALSSDIAKIKVDQVPEDSVGIYFLRYLEWLLTEVKNLRMKIDEGRAWLSTFNSKKKKRLGYWKMYKKHGTTFGLSHERTLATQTG